MRAPAAASASAGQGGGNDSSSAHSNASQTDAANANVANSNAHQNPASPTDATHPGQSADHGPGQNGGHSSDLPLKVDRNRDGLADAGQPDVYVLQTGQHGETVVLDAHGRQLQGLKNRPGRQHPSDEAILPYGTFEFSVGVDQPGDAATVDLYLPEGSRANTYFKQDPGTGQFYEFGYDGTTGAEIDGEHVTLHLVDGGRGDADGLANGVIVDPGGPGMTGVVTVPCPGSNGLDGWTITETGSTSDPGSVVVTDGHLVIREGDSFLVSLERDITIPTDPSILTFEYDAAFDATDQVFINDAFEAALLDADGNSLVPPFRTGNDSFFNWTEGEPVGLSSLTTNYPNPDGTSGAADLDISGLPAGSTARLVFRLANNDSDVNTTVRITCSQAPVAVDDAYSLDEDTTLTVAAAGVLANDTDADGDSLTALLEDNVSHGTLNLASDGSLTYTPDADFDGADTFTYRAFDGHVPSDEPAAVTITVTPVNDPPVAGDDAYTIQEDTALSGNVLSNDTDVDGDPLAAAKLTDPSHGSLVFNPNGSFSYTPGADFNGTDSFTYKVNDGTVDSNTATVTITITPMNDPPVAVNDAYMLDEDTTLTVAAASGVLANDYDVDGDAISKVLVDDVSHGTLTLNPDGSLVYVPAANYFGSDSFTYKVRDTVSESNLATVSLTINPINDPPQVADDEYAIKEDTTLTVAASAGVLINDSDIEGDTLSAVKVTDPAHGTLSLGSDGSLSYTPDSNYNGTDSFTYLANDGTDDSPTAATVTITISAVNDPPDAVADSYTVDEDVTLNVGAVSGVLANDSDVDADPLSAVPFSDPAHGSLNLNPDGSFTYTPDLNYNGTDSFVYRADDGDLKSQPTTVTITINPVNDAPVASDDAYTIDEDTPLSISARACWPTTATWTGIRFQPYGSAIRRTGR